MPTPGDVVPTSTEMHRTLKSVKRRSRFPGKNNVPSSQKGTRGCKLASCTDRIMSHWRGADSSMTTLARIISKRITDDDNQEYLQPKYHFPMCFLTEPIFR